ncbi:hypothetical protein BLNAU_3260 [Blattamonas nauphoetae]|uniref:Uncharacterized protein n=1 Tax=Blattamonas nauphoetae TaxID=2049346 RepID=A0ABQ9YDR1_9EUKA|nr:hypothetical protein BLNAU_3260 [Blattamonas nauphoetae]
MQTAIAAELEKLKEKKSGGVFLMTHTPTMYMNDPLRSDLIELLSTDDEKYPTIIALLNGHQHASFDRHFVNSERGTLGGSELNAVDFGSSRGFRLFTVDHGMVGWDDFRWAMSTDAETGERTSSPNTLVSVLNPPSSQQMTSRSGWSLVQNSTHLRVLIFSRTQPHDVFVVILEGKVSDADSRVQNACADTSILQNSRSARKPSPNSLSDALPTATFFALQRATSSNPNHLPLFISPWNPNDFTAVEQYTLVVVVNTSNSSSQPVHVSTPRFFSVQGFTQLPFRPLSQFGANLNVAKMTRCAVWAGETILLSVLVLSWMMPCFGCCLSRKRVGDDSNQESSSTGSDRKKPSALATLCQNAISAINETVSNPTPLLSDEDFHSRADIAMHCSPLLRFVSKWHLDRLAPFITNLLPFRIVVKLDRVRRKAEALRMMRRMRRAEKGGGMEVWDGTESEEESMRRFHLLSSNPHTPSLSFPSHSFITRIIQTLVRLVYPYSHLPPLAHLCIVVACIVLHTQPIIVGKPPDPQLSVRVHFNRNEQGGVSHDAFDTGQALWTLFVFGRQESIFLHPSLHRQPNITPIVTPKLQLARNPLQNVLRGMLASSRCSLARTSSSLPTTHDQLLQRLFWRCVRFFPSCHHVSVSLALQSRSFKTRQMPLQHNSQPPADELHSQTAASQATYETSLSCSQECFPPDSSPSALHNQTLPKTILVPTRRTRTEGQFQVQSAARASEVQLHKSKHFQMIHCQRFTANAEHSMFETISLPDIVKSDDVTRLTEQPRSPASRYHEVMHSMLF